MAGKIISNEGGVISRFHADGDKFHIQYTQDVEPIIEANKIAQQASNNGYSPSKDLKHVASIPVGVILVWMERYGVDYATATDMEFIKKRLNDPDWKHLRTGSGRI
jgi:hypothetical protein